MSERRNHYELAFEWYLNQRGIPFVAIEDVRHVVKGKMGAKVFDYVVYPVHGRPALVDVKGRKLSHAEWSEGISPKNWVTRADVVSMNEWQGIFGKGYDAVFAFAYWLAGTANKKTTPADPTDESVVTFVGRRYCLRLVKLSDYAKHQQPLSKRWDTLMLPAAIFKKVNVSLGRTWTD